MIITSDFIEKCVNLEACQLAIDYLTANIGKEYPAGHRPDWRYGPLARG